MEDSTDELKNRRIALRYLQEQANKRDHIDASIARVPTVALQLARTRHGSCRGVLGQLPTSGPVLQFECCDCHEIVGVSEMEASL